MTYLAEFLLARTAAVASAWAEMDDQHAAHREWVLGQCEAVRRVVELHRPDDPLEDGEEARELGLCTECDEQSWPCLTLCSLALPYAAHPDYQQEWRPWKFLGPQSDRGGKQ